MNVRPFEIDADPEPEVLRPQKFSSSTSPGPQTYVFGFDRPLDRDGDAPAFVPVISASITSGDAGSSHRDLRLASGRRLRLSLRGTGQGLCGGDVRGRDQRDDCPAHPGHRDKTYRMEPVGRYCAPRASTTTMTVLRRIRMSSHIDHRRAYSRSSSIHWSKSGDVAAAADLPKARDSGHRRRGAGPVACCSARPRPASADAARRGSCPHAGRSRAAAARRGSSCAGSHRSA